MGVCKGQGLVDIGALWAATAKIDERDVRPQQTGRCSARSRVGVRASAS